MKVVYLFKELFLHLFQLDGLLDPLRGLICRLPFGVAFARRRFSQASFLALVCRVFAFGAALFLLVAGFLHLRFSLVCLLFVRVLASFCRLFVGRFLAVFSLFAFLLSAFVVLL